MCQYPYNHPTLRYYHFLPFVLLLLAACTEDDAPDRRLTAPTGNLAFELLPGAKDEPLHYQVTRKQGDRVNTILPASRLGLELTTTRFTTGLKILSASRATLVTDEYPLPSGKQAHVKESGNERTFTLANPTGEELLLDVRVYDNGVAFRYRLPATTGDSTQRQLTAELTTFQIPAGDFWAQPYDTVGKYYPAYEVYYANGIPTGSPAPDNKNGWALPALFRTEQSWILLHESGVNGTNAGTHLDARPYANSYAVAYPEATEMFGKGSAYPVFTGEWASPWRLLVIGDLATITESTLVTTLAEDSKLTVTDWVRPGRAAWSWASAPDSPQDYNLLTPFIDFCADFGWEYFLEDANWDRMQNGDLEKLAAYANEKGVGLWVWYNSGGPHNVVTEAPRGRMMPDRRKAEMQMLRDLGIKGIKVDFFHSDKQDMMQHYLGILQDAADAQLMVNFHGCTVPRGWSRTYPNLMTMESVKGAENYIFDGSYSANAPILNTILPFTRNVVGPMDYTPVVFTDNVHPHRTTYGHELALGVLFQSGVQHFADRVSGYTDLPADVRAVLRDLPARWDETRYVSGTPGTDAVLARRRGETWYIAGINGTDRERSFALDLSPLGKLGPIRVITDGDGPRSFAPVASRELPAGPFTVNTQAYGGFLLTATTR